MEALEKPRDAVFRYVSERLREHFSGCAVLETMGSVFDLDRFEEKGFCTVVDSKQSLSQWNTYYWMPKHAIYQREHNTWREATWDGIQFEVITLHIKDQYRWEGRTYIVGPSKAETERFFLAVCKACTTIEGEVLVFSDGCWQPSSALYESIQGASFDNLILEGNLKESVRADAHSFFAMKETYEQNQIPWKRGILLIGPPGNGKTHMIKALINSLGHPCLYVRSFKVEHGTDQSAITNVFSRARDQAPCVMVLEDLDSLVDDRNRSFFLNELDGFAANSGILVIASTNHPEKLDPALLERPSRFDRKYTFALPAYAERLAYIQMISTTLTETLRVSQEVAEELARDTEGFSFAYLKELFVSSMMAWISNPEGRPFDEALRSQVAPLSRQIAAGIEAITEVSEAVSDDEEEEY